MGDRARGNAGAFRLRSALGRTLVLDVAGGSAANGANVQIHAANGSAAQTFTFVATERKVEPCDDILPEGWFSLASAQASSYVVDIAGASEVNGANAQMAAASGSASQLFRFEYRGGYYLIINGRSGKALDVDSGNPVPPTNVQQWSVSTGSANQQFSVVDNGGGTYSFVNRGDRPGPARRQRMGPGNGSNVDVAEADGSATQRFSLREAQISVEDGLYSLRPSGSGSTALTASSSGSVAQGTYRAGAAQKWFVERASAGQNAYVIESMSTGLCLGATSGGRVALQPATGSAGQRWAAHYAGGELVSFQNLESGTYLALSSSGSGLVLAERVADAARCSSRRRASSSPART